MAQVEFKDPEEAMVEDTKVAVEEVAAGVEITYKISKARLDCSGCNLLLKPPVFKCFFGHLACGACLNYVAGTGQCLVCEHASGYSQSTVMEDVVRTIGSSAPTMPMAVAATSPTSPPSSNNACGRTHLASTRSPATADLRGPRWHSGTTSGTPTPGSSKPSCMVSSYSSVCRRETRPTPRG
ncbi:unnamed protein product [Urochloa humidicola]